MGNTGSHQGGTPGTGNESPGLAPPPVPKRPTSPPEAPASPPPPATPLLLPYAGHLSPQNPHCLSHPQAHDYSKTMVTQLIIDSLLAPFYRGLDDFDETWAEEDIGRVLTETREADFDADVQNSYTQRLKELRQREAAGKRRPSTAGTSEDDAERFRRECKVYLGAVECPICFLNYPPNINTSRCCQQPLCTECFVQIKRSDATVTHLESDAACCPFCVETEFGVIYERPNPAPTPLTEGSNALVNSAVAALATSPEAGMSGFSVAVSEDTFEVGSPPPGAMCPVPRRKSVSSKAKEVVTIDMIRPDWETKLNAVKAAAARRASRRIVMRQVGDRLIPIGYTSSRATGQADFSMSIPPEEGGSRRSRRTREREREMEEMMIMEAMRLSLVDHEEHQRKIHDDRRDKNGNPTPPQRGTGNSTPSSSRRSSAAGQTLNSWRASSQSGEGGRAQAAASKLLSKITVNRSRANSKSSVHFAPSPTTMGSSPGSPGVAGPSRARSSSTPSPNMLAMGGDHHVVSPLAADENTVTRHSVDVPARVLENELPSTPPAQDQDPTQPASTLAPAVELTAPTPRHGSIDPTAMAPVSSAAAARNAAVAAEPMPTTMTPETTQDAPGVETPRNEIAGMPVAPVEPAAGTPPAAAGPPVAAVFPPAAARVSPEPDAHATPVVTPADPLGSAPSLSDIPALEPTIATELPRAPDNDRTAQSSPSHAPIAIPPIMDNRGLADPPPAADYDPLGASFDPLGASTEPTPSRPPLNTIPSSHSSILPTRSDRSDSDFGLGASVTTLDSQVMGGAGLRSGLAQSIDSLGTYEDEEGKVAGSPGRPSVPLSAQADE